MPHRCGRSLHRILDKPKSLGVSNTHLAAVDMDVRFGTSTFEVAIIGAGLSGLTLALALHQQGITATVYESRPAPLNIGGAVMLSPNALRIMDRLGIYDDLRHQGYNFDLLDFRNAAGDLLETYEFGGEAKYGYKALRIYRFELIDNLLKNIRARAISVQYGRKFSHVIEENDRQVIWKFTDGTTAKASLLVGADGIHSTVRRFLYPELVPEFTGIVGITAAIPASQVESDLGQIDRPLTIVTREKGAFVIAPQKVDASEYLIGKQKRIPEQTREGWNRIHADKGGAVQFLQQDAEIFGQIATSATSSIPHDKINIWPFYVIPKLDRWTSTKKRVVVLGDSAHAIPPSAGQGISQAYEDVYMFAILLKEDLRGKADLDKAMAFWQRFRQQRINQVLELNKQIDLRRMPIGDVSAKHNKFELEWLYCVDIDSIVQQWLRE